MPATCNVYLSDALNDQLKLEAENGGLTPGKYLTQSASAAMLGRSAPPSVASRVYALLATANEPVTHEDVAHELDIPRAVAGKTLANLMRLAPDLVIRTDIAGVLVWHLNLPKPEADESAPDVRRSA